MKKFLFFAAALLGLVACNNKGNEPINPGRQITLTATVDFGQGSNAPGRTVAPDTPIPTEVGSTVKFHWEKGDQILLIAMDASAECEIFTIMDDSIDGETAKFTGKELTNMNQYIVYYIGKNPSFEKLMAYLDHQTDSITYEANSFHPYVVGFGDEESILLDNFLTIFQIPLKGNATVGKLDYYMGDKETVHTTISFGTGLVLTNTATPVYFPINGVDQKGFTIKIYDTNDVCLLTKIVTDVSFFTEPNIYAFPDLTVNTAPE